MLIVDYSQVMISNIMMSVTSSKEDINEDLIRHFFLNSIRYYKSKFTKEFGEVVIACDHTNNWRKKNFPYYKANRKKSIETSTFDWKTLYECLGKIRNEVKEYFPYKLIHIETAEADDIIGALCYQYGNDLNVGEKILIISGDKDFSQLHKFGNVSQYDPVFKKKIFNCNNPEQFLKNHIICGDSGDGIPNMLSEDNCFVLGKRQSMMTKKRLERLMNIDISEYSDLEKRNFQRNQELIDLSFTPDILRNKIIKEYDEQIPKDRTNLMNYFIKFKLKNLMSSIQDF